MERVRVRRHDPVLYHAIVGAALHEGRVVVVQAAGKWVPAAVKLAGDVSAGHGIAEVRQVATGLGAGVTRRQDALEENVEITLAPAAAASEDNDPLSPAARAFAAFHEVIAQKEALRWRPLERLNNKTRHGPDKHGVFYVDAAGLMLKPCSGKLAKEKAAYEMLSAHPEFFAHLSAYHGTRKHDGLWHLVLSNELHDMTSPLAVADIKLGVKTYDEHAGEEKKARESAKVKAGHTSADGYRLVGLRSEGCGSHQHGPDVRASGGFTPAEFRERFLPVFRSAADPAAPCDPAAVRDLLAQLGRLRACMERGFGGDLRASSLLVVREQRPRGRVKVKVIDLAHYTPNPSPNYRDENYLTGLRALIANIECLAAEAAAS